MTDFSVFKLLFFFGIVIWLFPAIRQFRGNYFGFFLILAVTDPLSLLTTWILKLDAVYITIASTYFLFLSIMRKDFLKKNFLILLLIFMILMTPPIMRSGDTIIYTQLVLLLVFILFTILKTLITNYVDQKKLNLFYVVFVFYILTMILKFFNLLLGFADAIAFFIITSIAQIAFGLFFSVFKEDNPKLLV